MRKPEEVEVLRTLIDSLCIKNAIDKNIAKYLYHFTDIENAINILESGKLYSRHKAIELGLMSNENASADVINRTSDSNKEFVRLYFRPKTPTQYRNEGLKSKYKSYDYEAHCPIPIFFQFCSVGILSHKSTNFVERNLASNPIIKEDISDLINFDFENIYHSHSILDSDNRQDIIAKRHAEVLIKDSCDFKELECINCRSIAEKETLLSLMREKNITINENIPIHVDNDNILFQKNNTFIDYVELNQDKFRIKFQHLDKLDEKDSLSIILESEVYNKTISLSNQDINSNQVFNIEDSIDDDYKLKVSLNDKLIYYGNYTLYSDLDLPF